MANDEFILIRIRRRIAYLISNILRGASVHPHYKASQSTNEDEIMKLRQEGNDLHQVAKDIERELHPEKHDDCG